MGRSKYSYNKKIRNYKFKRQKPKIKIIVNRRCIVILLLLQKRRENYQHFLDERKYKYILFKVETIISHSLTITIFYKLVRLTPQLFMKKVNNFPEGNNKVNKILYRKVLLVGR